MERATSFFAGAVWVIHLGEAIKAGGDRNL